jgi:hypothetical protein
MDTVYWLFKLELGKQSYASQPYPNFSILEGTVGGKRNDTAHVVEQSASRANEYSMRSECYGQQYAMSYKE